jgi:hypothetical protein
MAKRTIETNLMGDVVQFDTVPNHDLSDGVGTIRGVYAPKDSDRLVYVILMASGPARGRLIETTGSFFKVIQAGEGK